MSAPLQGPARMSAEQFVVLAEQQASGRYELLDGQVVAMAPERAGHVRSKMRIADLLEQAIEAIGGPCEAFIDGLGFAVDEGTGFIPDAIVRCGDRLHDDASTMRDPVIVVEALSPSTRDIDTTIKLERYFSVRSVQHYLIVRTDSPAIVHHRRVADGILTQIVQPGPLRLDPPGITLEFGSP